MRFLQLVLARGVAAPTRDPEHAAKVGKTIREKIASGHLLATGGLGKRATAAARVMKRGADITVEDPPSGDGWMAAGGYALTQFASKEDAIANARATLEMMGDADVELIQVSEMHPPSSGGVHYIEMVTPEPARIRDVYEALHGVRFDQVEAFGGAFVAMLPGGTRLGVRAPMHAAEKHVTRTYVRVADVEAATKRAEELGAFVALSPTELAGHGRIAIFMLGDIEHGVWQPQ